MWKDLLLFSPNPAAVIEELILFEPNLEYVETFNLL
jgi:hypothetical protein